MRSFAIVLISLSAAGCSYLGTAENADPADFKREDGWILVEVADENTNPVYFVPGDLPTRWLNIATAISIQEMRPHQ